MQRWRFLTLITAAVTGVVLGIAPVMATSSCATTNAGPSICTSSHTSLISTEGSRVLLVLALPALVALVAVVMRTHRSTLFAAVTLSVAAVLGIASIGIFFVPTVASAWLAVRASRDGDHARAAPTLRPG